MSEHLNELRAEVRHRLPEKLRHPSYWADDVETLVREHPFETAGAAFAGGLVIGLLVGVGPPWRRWLGSHR